MTQWTDIDQKIAEMVRDGYTPGAIIGSPVQLKRLMALPPDERHYLHGSGGAHSGWEYQGLPIARCYEISGPCVVSREVYHALRKCGRTEFPGRPEEGGMLVTALAPQVEHNPILF